MTSSEAPNAWLPSDPWDASAISPVEPADCWLPAPWDDLPPAFDLEAPAAPDSDPDPSAAGKSPIDPEPDWPGPDGQAWEAVVDWTNESPSKDAITGLSSWEASSEDDPTSGGSDEPWLLTAWEPFWPIPADPGDGAGDPGADGSDPVASQDAEPGGIDLDAWIPTMVICEPCPYPPLPEGFWEEPGVPSGSDHSTGPDNDPYAVSETPEDWICVLPPPLIWCFELPAPVVLDRNPQDPEIADTPPPRWRPLPRAFPFESDSPAPDDDVYGAYLAFLRENPTWKEENGAGGIQLQVITPSAHQPWIELSTPGAARAFDAWFERHVMAVRGAGRGGGGGAPDGGDKRTPDPEGGAGPIGLDPPSWTESATDPTAVDALSSTPMDEGPSDPAEADATVSDAAGLQAGAGSSQAPAASLLETAAVLVLPAAPERPTLPNRSETDPALIPATEARPADSVDRFDPDRIEPIAADLSDVEDQGAAGIASGTDPDGDAWLDDSPSASEWLLLRQQKLLALPAWLLRRFRLTP